MDPACVLPYAAFMFRKTLSLCTLALCAVGCGPKATTGGPTGNQDGTQAILQQSELPDTLSSPLPDDALGVTVHRLKNGLTVYISPNPGEPRVSAWIAVRAGSRHDPANSTGLAHYLEHMLFKGTRQLGVLDSAAEAPHIERIAALYDELARAGDDDAERARILKQVDEETGKASKYAIPNELDQLYARMGITGVNAFTGNEQTVYIADVPVNRFEAWAKLEAERFQNPVFRLFYPELESVYEEKNISMDRPISRVFDSMFLGLFPEHPYGTQSTIGKVEHLKTPAYADMAAYYERFYIPNNIAIVLAGDLDAETALPVLEKHFGSWQAKPLVPPAPAAIEPLTGRKQIEITASGESAVYLGWLAVPASHKDAPVIEVIDLLMDNAATGLINVELVLSQKLPSAGSFPQLLREAGAWMMYGVARDGQSLDEVEQLLLGVVDKLRQGAFSQADLDALVLHAEMRAMRESEENRTRVGKMTGSFIGRVPWPDAARRSAKLRAVTREQVMAAAQKYLGDAFVSIRRNNGEYAPPKIPKPKITPIAIDPSKKSPFAESIESMPTAPIASEWLTAGTHYERRTLATGPMLAVHNKRNELFSITYRYWFGTWNKPLICFALELMEQSGIDGLSADALQRKLYAMGTTVRTQCSDDEVSITVEGIDRNIQASVTLLQQWLSGAALDEDKRQKLVANTVSKRKDVMDNPSSLQWALVSFASLGDDSEFLAAPSNEMLRTQATVPALRALLASLLQHKHDTLYFGPRTADAAAAIVPLGKGQDATDHRHPIAYRQIDGKRIFFVQKDMAQARIAIFMPEASLPKAAWPQVELYNEYVGGGMGALIFQEMREARGLAYSAWAQFRTGRRVGDAATLLGIIGTQADKTIDALTTMLQLLRDTPMSEGRLATAKRSLDARYRTQRIVPRQIADEVLKWTDLGLIEDPRLEYANAVQAMNVQALAAFAKRFSGDRPLIIGILGDKKRIDMDALKNIAPVEEVSISQLFSY